VKTRVIRNIRKWQSKNQDIIKQWKDNNIERIRECERTRYMLNPERFLDQDKNQRRLIRHKAMLIVGNGVIKCVNCDCNRDELLQINHKNGGGSIERRKNGWSGQSIAAAIVSGRRQTDDLELRCYPCNALHAMEIKYGKLPMKIKWGGDE
jgi:hypothetical protein